MLAMEQYCRNWRLIPSAAKTLSSVFHLHHASARLRANRRTEWAALAARSKSRIPRDNTRQIFDELKPSIIGCKSSDKKQPTQSPSRVNMRGMCIDTAGMCAIALLLGGRVLCAGVGSVCPHRLGRRAAQHSHAYDVGDLQVDTACLAASTQQYCPTPCSARSCSTNNAGKS